MLEEEAPGILASITHGLNWSVISLFVCTLAYMLTHGVRAGVWSIVLLEAVDNDVERAAYLQGAITGGYHLIAFVVANPVFGTLSDYTDRRKFLVFGLLGVAIDSILITQRPTVNTLIIGAVIRGLSHCFVAVAASSIAEVSTPASRGKNMALIGVAYGIGAAGGQLVGGHLAADDLMLPFYISAAVAVLGILFTVTCVPSLDRYAKREASWVDAINPVRNICIMFDTPALRVLSVVYVFHVIGVHCMTSILVLYTRYKFDWDTVEFGNFMFVYGILVALVQAVVVRVLFSTIGEARSLVIGLLIKIVEFFTLPFIGTSYVFYCVVFPCVLSVLVWPATRALFSRQAGMSNQGQIMGALATLTTLGDMVGDTLAAEILGLAIALERSLKPSVPDGSTPLAGVPFFFGGLAYCISLFWWLRYSHLVTESEGEMAELENSGDAEFKVAAP